MILEVLIAICTGIGIAYFFIIRNDKKKIKKLKEGYNVEQDKSRPGKPDRPAEPGTATTAVDNRVTVDSFAVGEDKPEPAKPEYYTGTFVEKLVKRVKGRPKAKPTEQLTEPTKQPETI